MCKYDNIGDVFAPDCKFVHIRVISALFGAALPLLVHAIVLALGASSHAAFFAGALTIFDMLNVTESRLVLTDSQVRAVEVDVPPSNTHTKSMSGRHACIGLCGAPSVHVLPSNDTVGCVVTTFGPWLLPHPCPSLSPLLCRHQLMFYAATSLLLALQYWKRVEALEEISKKMSKRETNLWVLALGLSCGAAVSIKWTALATPFMVAIESAFGIFGFVKRRVAVQTLAKVAAVVVIQYSVWFWWHFTLLPLTGGGDPFMPVEFQATLKGSQFYNVRV